MECSDLQVQAEILYEDFQKCQKPARSEKQLQDQILHAWSFRQAKYLLSELRGCGGGRDLGESLMNSQSSQAMCCRAQSCHAVRRALVL